MEEKQYTENEIKKVVDERIDQMLKDGSIYKKVRKSYFRDYAIALLIMGVVFWGIFIIWLLR